MCLDDARRFSEHRAHWTRFCHYPDDYLVTLFEIEPYQVIAVLGEMASRRRMETEDVLIQYGTVIPKFSSRIHAHLSE
jgi:hypothetical protein